MPTTHTPDGTDEWSASMRSAYSAAMEAGDDAAMLRVFDLHHIKLLCELAKRTKKEERDA